jgi:hypothetical protein
VRTACLFLGRLLARTASKSSETAKVAVQGTRRADPPDRRRPHSATRRTGKRHRAERQSAFACALADSYAIAALNGCATRRRAADRLITSNHLCPAESQPRLNFGATGRVLECVADHAVSAEAVTPVPEIGLRMALGADRALVLRMILREALVLVVLGAVVGVPFAYLAGRSVRTLLYGIPPLDPTAYATAAILLIVVSVLAAYLPARRASRIEPMIALNR